MKTCGNCGASNPDSAKFCTECAQAFVPLAPSTRTAPPPTRNSSSGPLTRVVTTQGKRKADIMFVLDCTGSMQGEINAIRDSIMSFADTIKSDGVRARVGLIEFRDRLHGEEARVLTFNGEVFTTDPNLFRAQVSKLVATGGDDAPESSLDAVMLALRQSFADDTNKVIVLITDAPPHIPDKETRGIEEVKAAIQRVRVQQFYIVMRTQDSASQVYLQLLEGTRGMAFELGKGDDFRSRADHFKRTLMSLGKTISASTT